jgi:hypothetical protein
MLKLNCPASGNAEEMILSIILGDFVEELVQADLTAAILPWKSIYSAKGSINKPTKIPKNTKLLRTYTNKFFISPTPDKQFATYPGIFNNEAWYTIGCFF